MDRNYIIYNLTMLNPYLAFGVWRFGRLRCVFHEKTQDYRHPLIQNLFFFMR